MELPGQSLATEVRFDASGPHPVALALIAALSRRGGWLRYGIGA